MARYNLLTYPYFNETFKIHNDISAFQLGAVISQKVKPIALYSRKNTDSQQRHKVTERELLSIVKTLKEFRNILLGQNLRIRTDHKNLTYNNFSTDRVLIWRLILEYYGPDIKYIKGEKIYSIIFTIKINIKWESRDYKEVHLSTRNSFINQ